MDTIAQPKSLTEQTHDILLNAICSGEFEPGQRLHQDDIAARLRVSRQPVNSAISILKANGFVEDTGRRGVVVSSISVDQFRSIYEFRGMLEPFAIRLAHGRMPPDAAERAQDLLRQGWAAVKSRDPIAQIDTDFEFHKMIYGWTGNETIQQTMRLHWHHIRRAMSLVVRMGVAAEQSWREHEVIIARLMTDDVEAAELAMKQHIESAQTKTLAVLVSTSAAAGQ